jgi:hypothetical protein
MAGRRSPLNLSSTRNQILQLMEIKVTTKKQSRLVISITRASVRMGATMRRHLLNGAMYVENAGGVTMLKTIVLVCE